MHWAAARMPAGVMWLSVPRSSSWPPRPQFDRRVPMSRKSFIAASEGCPPTQPDPAHHRHVGHTDDEDKENDEDDQALQQLTELVADQGLDDPERLADQPA